MNFVPRNISTINGKSNGYILLNICEKYEAIEKFKMFFRSLILNDIENFNCTIFFIRSMEMGKLTNMDNDHPIKIPYDSLTRK